MKKLNYLLGLLFISVIGINVSVSQMVSATYSAGDIPAMDGAYDNTCNGPVTPLIVSLPGGSWMVDSVSVSYDITADATAGNWMSEQRSQLACQESGTDESAFSSGSGSSAGTMSYSRSGLTFANGIYTGDLTFEMQAYRTWSDVAGCNLEQKIDNGTWTVNVFYSTPPTCPAPTSLDTLNSLTTSIDLDWTDNASASSWQIEYGTSTFSPGTGTTVVAGSKPYNLSGLNSGTDYDYYVRAICGSGDSSVWVGPKSFTTVCGIITPDYTQNFTSFTPNCWDQADDGNTTTGPTTIGSSSWISNTNLGNSISINLFTNTRSDWILSPFFDLSGGTYELSIDAAVTDWLNASAGTMGSDDSVAVYYSENGTTWIRLIAWTAADALPNTLSPFVVSIPSSGNNVQIGILATDGPVDDSEDYDFHVNNFIVRTQATCPQPSSISLDNLLSSTVDINWFENGSAISWQYEYGPDGFSIGSGNVVIASNDTVSLSGLTGVTDYDFYVRSICGAGDTSQLVGPFNFITSCGTFTAPFTENFDGSTTPSCWLQSATSGGPWEFGQLGAADYDASLIEEYTNNGGYYAWMDFSTGPADAGVIIETPEIDVTALTIPELAFFMYSHNTNSTDLNTLLVEAYDGSSWNNVATIQEDNGGWTRYGYNVVSNIYSGNLVKFRLRAEPTSTGTEPYNNDLLIDNFTVYEMATCPQPSALDTSNISTTSVDLDWAENGSASSWQIEYGTSGFSQGSGTSVIAGSIPYSLTGLSSVTDYGFYVRSICGSGDTSLWVGPTTFTTLVSCPAPSALTATSIAETSADLMWTENGSASSWQIEYGTSGFSQGSSISVITGSNPFSLTGLSSTTSYDYYVRAICGSGDTSLWVTPFTFTTPCATYTPYYLEDFTSFVPTCWDEADDGDAASGPSNFGGSSWSGNTTFGSGAAINLWASSKSDWLLSPNFDLSSGGYELSINVAISAFGGGGFSNMGSDDRVQVLYTEDGTTWVNLIAWNNSNGITNALTNYIVSIPSSGTNVRFGILGSEGSISDAEDYYFHVDDFIVRVPPACPQPTNLQSNALTTSSELSWTENGSATDWIIEYGPSGFTPGSGTTVNVSTNPYTLTGLNSGTDYDFYVQSDCGGGDVSLATGSSSFSTSVDYCAGDHFYDTGGATGDYSSGENETTVICGNSSSEAVTVSFVSFDVEATWDDLSIYDGNSTAGTLLGTYDGTTSPPDYTSTHTSGCLTFVFNSDFSGERAGWDAIITCVNPNCSTPNSLIVNSISGISANLGWVETGTASSWEIEYGPTGFSLGSGSKMVTNSNPSFVSGLTIGTEYDFYVRALCSGGDTSAVSNLVSGTTSTDGIEIALNSKVKIYPNPSNGVVNIDFENLTYTNSVEFISVTGEILKTILINTNSTSIDVSDLSSGLYTLRIQNDNGIGYKKLIIE